MGAERKIQDGMPADLLLAEYWGGVHPNIERWDTGSMARKEAYCEDCGNYQPMVEHEPQKDARNPYPWYDITCGTCCSIIATVQIVPDDKPVEPPRVVEEEQGATVRIPLIHW